MDCVANSGKEIVSHQGPLGYEASAKVFPKLEKSQLISVCA